MQKEIKKGDGKSKALSPFHIEVDKVGRAFSVSICEVRSVTELSDNKVSLKLKKGSISVSGSELEISVYENSIVEIYGIVRGIELL